MKDTLLVDIGFYFAASCPFFVDP